MKRTILLSIVPVFLFFYTSSVIAQEKIAGKSSTFKFKASYQRGLPPNLFADLSFQDQNANGILESEETAELKLTLTNKGKGPAQGLEIQISDSFIDSAFSIVDKQKINYIFPEKSVTIDIPIAAGFKVKSGEHRLEINVKEHFGYDMDPAYLVLNSLEFQSPKLVFSGLEVIDVGNGLASIDPDGQLQAGELVRVKIFVQNIGQNLASNIEYKIESRDPNIYLEEASGYLDKMKIGEVKNLEVIVSPNKRVNTNQDLPLYITITEDFNEGNLVDFQLPLRLNQKPADQAIVEVKVDMEKIKKQVARFEYTSNKFTANVGNIQDIKSFEKNSFSRPNTVAVVIGVESYLDLPPAPFADNDARIVSEYFQDRLGIEKVVAYTNEEVTGFAFDDIFNADYGELQRAVIKGETEVFVFYSGHGVPNKAGDEIFLFPSDGKVERLETQGYNINKLYENLEKLGAKSVTVFIDACFSGASRTTEKISTENLIAMKGVRVKPKTLTPWMKPDINFSVFNSSSGDETSLGFDQSQTGLFTYFLCLGMQGEADLNKDRKITYAEMHSYLTENVTSTSKKISGIQTPEFHGNPQSILLEY